MNKTYYIKSYSKGQFTLPKEVRDALGLGNDFWLQLDLQGNQIRLQPVTGAKLLKEPEVTQSDYATLLKDLDTTWFDHEEYKKMKDDIKKRVDSYEY